MPFSLGPLSQPKPQPPSLPAAPSALLSHSTVHVHRMQIGFTLRLVNAEAHNSVKSLGSELIPARSGRLAPLSSPSANRSSVFCRLPWFGLLFKNTQYLLSTRHTERSLGEMEFQGGTVLTAFLPREEQILRTSELLSLASSPQSVRQ